MNIRIKQIGMDATVSFAVEELWRYVRCKAPRARLSRLMVEGFAPAVSRHAEDDRLPAAVRWPAGNARRPGLGMRR